MTASIPFVREERRVSAGRLRVRAEAVTWLRTPFHHRARVKHQGVDCAMLLAEVFERAGQISHIEPPEYSSQWHMHRAPEGEEQEKFLPFVEQFAEPCEVPLPGDVAMFKIGRSWSHGAIVIDWPVVIHAWFSSCVEWSDASKEPLRAYPVKFFTLKEWKP